MARSVRHAPDPGDAQPTTNLEHWAADRLYAVFVAEGHVQAETYRAGGVDRVHVIAGGRQGAGDSLAEALLNRDEALRLAKDSAAPRPTPWVVRDVIATKPEGATLAPWLVRAIGDTAA